MEKFSVLMSVYKNENPIWFKEALDSIFANTIQPNEIVLVKDGPLTEELDLIIKQYSDKYPIFNIIANSENLGLGLSLRKGVVACKYDIIARMDTDDIIPADRFEKELIALKQDIDVVSCIPIIFVDTPSNIIAKKKKPELHDDIVKMAKRRTPICHAATMMRKEAILNAGNYLSKLYYEDYHLWIRMIMSGAKFYNIQEPLYYVRTYPTQISRRHGLAYLKRELGYLNEFYKMGFYSAYDLFVNSAIRIVGRLVPRKLSSGLFKIIWNH